MLTMQTMSLSDLKMALEWAAAEGWNPGLQDAVPFYAADPEGFFMGMLEGKPVSCIAMVRYDPAFAFLGLYLVRPDQRKRGYGWRTWQHAIAFAGGRTIGLDGVPAQQENYQQAGFRLAYRNIRHEGVGEGKKPPGVVGIEEIPFDELLAYDRRHFPASRSDFLRVWIKPWKGAGYAVVDGGRLVGYGVIRPCRRGFKIGPLFADRESIAEQLLDALSSHAAGQQVFLDTPEPNAAAVRLAGRRGFKPVFETARMYSGPFPDLPIDQVYGVTTFELG